MERIGRHPDEADLPAQEAASRQGARLPRPDEVARGPAHARATPGPRSQEALRLTPARGARRPRLVMITRPSDFAALQRDGTSRSTALLSVRVRHTDLAATRFAFSTGKKLGGAVVRNRTRRRIREALRPMIVALAPGWDVLVVARPATAEAPQAAIAADLARLLTRVGILGTETRA